MKRQIKIIVEKHNDGYVAYPPGISGVVVGEGDTYESTLANVKSSTSRTSREAAKNAKETIFNFAASRLRVRQNRELLKSEIRFHIEIFGAAILRGQSLEASENIK